MAEVKVSQDVNKCLGCGACAGVAPEIFEMKEIDGLMKAQIIGGEPTGEDGVSSKMVDDGNPMLTALPGMCPGQAIAVENA